jgi:hypothetical protein
VTTAINEHMEVITCSGGFTDLTVLQRMISERGYIPRPDEMKVRYEEEIDLTPCSVYIHDM